MSKKQSGGMNRRSMMTAAAGVAGAALAGGVSPAVAGPSKETKVKTYKSADFYDADGNFQVDTARDAYLDMFARFHYPFSDRLKDGENGMWILDFGLNDFANVGMAGIFWLNRQDYNYFGHEIYLLPGQMIPEHSHLPTDKGAAKMESWQPRKGMIYTFGEGDPTPDLLCKIPESQREIVKSKHCLPLGIDEIGDLNRLEAFHFMVAGPEGALVTEYGTFHDMDGLRFSNPKATL